MTWFSFCFDFVRSHGIIWKGGVRLKLDVQGQGGAKILEADGQGDGGVENWTIFIEVICVSSLR